MGVALALMRRSPLGCYTLHRIEAASVYFYDIFTYVIEISAVRP